MDYGIGTYHKHDFLSEGDSPTILILLPNGLRNLDNVDLGGIAGRYKLDNDKFNSKGQPLNYWNPVEDEQDIIAKPNSDCAFHMTIHSSNSSNILLETQAYTEISVFNPKVDIIKATDTTYSLNFNIPDDVNDGDIAHLIIRATSTNEIPLVSYKRLSITIKK